jgi:glycerol uptake facilitator protein
MIRFRQRHGSHSHPQLEPPRQQQMKPSRYSVVKVVWILLLLLRWSHSISSPSTHSICVAAFHSAAMLHSHPHLQLQRRGKQRSHRPCGTTPILSSQRPAFRSVLNLRGGGSNDNSRSSSENRRRNSRLTTTSTSEDHNRSFRWQLPLREMMAELTGTFLIVQIGTAAIMSSIFMGNGLSGGLYPIAVLWSIAVTIAICCTASISGAHLNPAITIALALFRRTSFPCTKIIPYIIAQFSGAMLASGMNLMLFHPHIVQFETLNGIIRSSKNAIPSAKAFGEYFVGISTIQAFIVELFGTFVLSMVIFSLTHPRNNQKNDSGAAGRSAWIPPLIGSTVAALICTLAPLTQAGFNPARDFGPRIVAYFAGWKSVAFFPYRTSWIVYILGPIVGAILGAAYTDFVLYRPEDETLKHP